MKFGEHLSIQAKPEWRDRHIDYERLKAVLYARVNDVGDQRDGDFFKKCADELKKINAFYIKRVANCYQRCQALEIRMKPTAAGEQRLQSTAMVKCVGRIRSAYRRFVAALRHPFGSGEHALAEEKSGSDFLPEQEMKQLKVASEEFYFELECLKKFQEDNATGFRKILKKHDKLWQNSRGGEWYQRKVANARFVTDKAVDALCERVEKFRTGLEGGDRKKAMEKLRVPSSIEGRSACSIFSSGFFWAVFLSAFALSMFFTNYTSTWWQPPWVIVRLYRGYFLICLNVTLHACSMYLWRRNGVNYVLIFELNPRKHMTAETLFTIAGACWALWAIALLGYIAAPWLNLPRLVFPLALTALYVLLLFNPFKCAYRDARLWFLRRIWSCFTAAFQSGMFADFWMANQMTTLSTAFVDTHFLVCSYATGVQYAGGWLYLKVTNTTAAMSLNRTEHDYDYVYDPEWGVDPKSGSGFCTSDAYGIRPTVAMIPAFIRLVQSLRRYRDSKVAFPHLYNAAKYLMYFPVAIFGALYKWHAAQLETRRTSASPYFHLWMISAAITSGVSFYWDIRIDWLLLSKRPGKRPLLRKKLLYSFAWTYYAAAIFDGVVRLRWVTQVALRHAHSTASHAELVTTVLAVAECLRRFVWGVFKLEGAQLNNVERLRVTRLTFAVPCRKLEDFGKMMKQAADANGNRQGVPLKKSKSPPSASSASEDE